MKNLFLVTMAFAFMVSCSGHKEVEDTFHKNQTGLYAMEKRPTYLYKVLSVEDWGKSCKKVSLSSMDTDFIHLSTKDQLDRIIEKYWADASQYVLLKLDVEKLKGKLVLEANPGGTNKYYHLYNGSVPLSSIVEMKAHKK